MSLLFPMFPSCGILSSLVLVTSFHPRGDSSPIICPCSEMFTRILRSRIALAFLFVGSLFVCFLSFTRLNINLVKMANGNFECHSEG